MYSKLHIVGSRGEPGGPPTSRPEQPHKQKRHHTLTQNLKAMCVWVLLLIRCSAFTFLSDVGHITHTCTQHSPLSVSPSNSSSSPFKRKLLLACIAVAGFSATNRHCTVVATFCANGLVASVVPFVERNSDTTVGSRGEPGDRPHRGPNNRTSKRDTTLLPKTLRQ